jgi:hypothetical protein
LTDIIGDADNEIFEDNLLLINDAYQVIMAIVSTPKGRQAFISNRCGYWSIIYHQSTIWYRTGNTVPVPYLSVTAGYRV